LVLCEYLCGTWKGSITYYVRFLGGRGLWDFITVQTMNFFSWKIGNGERMRGCLKFRWFLFNVMNKRTRRGLRHLDQTSEFEEGLSQSFSKFFELDTFMWCITMYFAIHLKVLVTHFHWRSNLDYVSKSQKIPYEWTHLSITGLNSGGSKRECPRSRLGKIWIDHGYHRCNLYLKI